MNAAQLAEFLRDRAQALEESAPPMRGPRAPRRPDGLSETDVTALTLRLIAAEYRELARLVDGLPGG
jgi:hypothetical protein